MVFFGGGGNGQWTRASNKENAEAFLAEQRMKADEDRERLQRSAAFRHTMWTKLRSMLRRSST